MRVVTVCFRYIAGHFVTYEHNLIYEQIETTPLHVTTATTLELYVLTPSLLKRLKSCMFVSLSLFAS